VVDGEILVGGVCLGDPNAGFKENSENFYENMKKLTDEIGRSGAADLKGALQRAGIVTDPAENISTFLVEAAQNGLTDFMKVLLRAGADIDRPGQYGQTPLMAAVGAASRHRLPRHVETLIEAGADPNVRDMNGRTALIYAALTWDDRRSSRLVRLLVKAGADVQTRDRFGETALSIAVQFNRPATAALLRQSGAKDDPESGLS
jgi:ankyrin repeat protein